MSRELKIQQVYLHFKYNGSGPKKNFMYRTMCIAESVKNTEENKINSYFLANIMLEEPRIKVELRQKKDGKIIILLDAKEKERYVIYRALYDEKVWARKEKIFLSLVDKKKYPKSKQLYRFEECEEEL